MPALDDDPDQLFTASEAAAYLGVHRGTLKRWGDTGKLAYQRRRINNYRMYRKGDLDEVARVDQITTDRD